MAHRTPNPTDRSDLGADALLAELGWLRTLAGSLVRDPHLADDLVQDTCAIALQRRAEPRQPRAWLTTVLRHLLLAHRRREQIRERREHDRDEAVADDAVALLQRAEAQRELVGAVIALDEPYRSTVLLRFFDGLAPRRIAARQGVPVATVHSRLQRALTQLRTRLDRTAGGRPAWLAALAPFAATFPHPAFAGVVLMQTKLKIAVAATVLACTVPFWWPAVAADAEVAPLGEPGAASRHGSGSGGGGRAGGSIADRARGERTAIEPRALPTPAPTAPALHTIAGRVCDGRGAGLPGVEIRANDEDGSATSDAAGRFELATAATAARLATTDDAFVTVLAGDWSEGSTIEPVVVVAPAVAVAGRTIEASGAPVTATRLRLELPADFESRFAIPLDRAGVERWATTSDGNGGFALPRLPRIEGAELVASADAFVPTRLALPNGDERDLAVVMQRFRYADGELVGRVLDPAGAPAGGARVAMGLCSVVTDRDGRFGLSLRRAGWPSPIVAAKAGYLPARLEVPKGGGSRREEWGADLVLRLGPAPQSARGRVIDQDRRGVAGAEVWLHDPTPLGVAGIFPLQIEYLIAGGAVPPHADSRPVEFADDPTQDGNFIDQGAVPKPSAGWFYVTTDDDGGFELPGLLDRVYELRALDPTSGLFGSAAGVTGGSFHEIAIDRSEVWPELRGQVVSLTGRPVAGVQVEQLVIAHAVNARVPGGRFAGTALRRGRAATTDADGRFVLRDVGRRSCYFALSGDAIVPTRFETADIGDPTDCTATVEARCHVEVALLDPAEADEILCLDDTDRQVDLAVLRRNSNQFVTELALHDGRSGLFVVGQRAATIVLRRDGVPVRRIAIAPDPTRTTTVN